MSAPDQLGRLCSFYLYYTTAMTDTLLWRAIRLLVGGDATAVRDRGAGAILSRPRPHASLNDRTPDEACTHDGADTSPGLRPVSCPPNVA